MTIGSRGTEPGFTLIELLVVMSIIIIMSAAAIPYGISFVRNYQVEGAAQNVAAEIHRARAQAVKRNTSRGILLNFNYPQAGAVQFTSLDPDPMTGVWDGGVYPANPGVYRPGTVNYGDVPAPPDNVTDPAGAEVQSPHGAPLDLPQDLGFDAGQRNALLFRADGSVVAVDAQGAVGAAAVSPDPNTLDWLITVVDPRTGLTRIIRVSRNGLVRVELP